MSIDDENTIDQLLRTNGAGKRILDVWGDLPHLAHNLDAVTGITPTQRMALKAAFQLRFVRDEPANMVVNSPADAAAIVADIAREPQEVLVVLCLNSRNRVIHKEVIYRGSVNSSQVRVGEVFRPAIVQRATAIIVAHNHPSGDPTPSPDDVAVTRTIVSAGKLLDIDLLDHIVIGEEMWASLKERGLGFS